MCLKEIHKLGSGKYAQPSKFDYGKNRPFSAILIFQWSSYWLSPPTDHCHLVTITITHKICMAILNFSFVGHFVFKSKLVTQILNYAYVDGSFFHCFLSFLSHQFHLLLKYKITSICNTMQFLGNRLVSAQSYQRPVNSVALCDKIWSGDIHISDYAHA